MASLQNIKNRRKSIQSTQQITKAMKLVSTVRLQHTKERAQSARPYFESLYKTMSSIMARTDITSHPYSKSLAGGKIGVLMITSDRGMAGGYNNNVVKKLMEWEYSNDQIIIYTLGLKGEEILQRQGYSVDHSFHKKEESSYEEAREITDYVLKDFAIGRIHKFFIAYTSFENTVVYEPRLVKLLPLESLSEKEPYPPMNYDMDEEEALNHLIPRYLTGMIYGALIEASASEHGARMQAMEASTSNAQDMLEELNQAYHRARQSAITQELNEIIAGSEVW